MENGEVGTNVRVDGDQGVGSDTHGQEIQLEINGGLKSQVVVQESSNSSTQIESTTVQSSEVITESSSEVVESSTHISSQSSSEVAQSSQTQSSTEVFTQSSSEILSSESTAQTQVAETSESITTEHQQQQEEVNHQEVLVNSHDSEADASFESAPAEASACTATTTQVEVECPESAEQLPSVQVTSSHYSEGDENTQHTHSEESRSEVTSIPGGQVTTQESKEADFRREVTEGEDGVKETEIVRTFVHKQVVRKVIEVDSVTGEPISSITDEQQEVAPEGETVSTEKQKGEEEKEESRDRKSSTSSSSSDDSHTKKEKDQTEEKEVDTTQGEASEGGASPLKSPHVVPLSPEAKEEEEKQKSPKSPKHKRFFGLFSRKGKDEKKEKKEKEKKEGTLEKKKKSALKKGKKEKGSESPESPSTPKKVTTEGIVEGEKIREVTIISLDATAGSEGDLDITQTSEAEVEVKEEPLEAVDAKASEQQTKASIEFIPIEVEQKSEEDKDKAPEEMAASEELAKALAQEKLAQGETAPEGTETALGVEHQEQFIVAERPKSMAIPDAPRSPGSGSQSPSPTVITPPEVPSTSIQLKVPSPYAPRPEDNYEGAVARSHRSSVDSGTGSDPARAPGHFVVVAIDFGTTFSGYAFSFTRDPDSIHMMRKWEGGDPGVINQKTPTTLLLKPDGTFHSFGFSARDFFHDLDPNEAKKWLYFEKFKMALHYNAELNKDTTLKASNGKLVPALTVFAHALRFFKEHALQELTDQSSTKIINEDVRWVLTVPAIWKAPAKQFMRQAAYMAGIASQEFPDQLIIALEPEAASIYCRKLRLHQLVPEKPVKTPLTPTKRGSTPEPGNMDKISDDIKSESSTPPATPDSLQASVYPAPENLSTVASEVQVPGTRYMVVDCGGGTVDITVHEMESKYGNLKELYKATGGPYGSVGVDLEFEKLLIAIFGAEFIDAFKYKRPAGWVDLMIAFESRKRAANPYKNNALNVSLPFSFIDYYKKYKSSQVESAIRKYSSATGERYVQWSSQGMLRLYPDAMNRLFTPTLDNIRKAIGDVLNNPSVKDIKYLFLVGGFAESPVLQNSIRKEFGHLLRIIIPQDVGLTILKGAVCFGLDPTVVHVRKSRMTYGVGVLNRFIKGKHPQNKLVSKDGVDWCTDVYDKFVLTDQSVALGDSVLRAYTPAKPGQKSSIINIYCSENSKPNYITDSGVKKCGTLVLDLTDLQYQQVLPKRREIQARMVFGDTEIKASALDVATGKCVKASIDFLNK